MNVIARPGLERRLKAEGVGEVMFDAFNRGRYATDASSYQMMPIGVVVPRSVAEAERAMSMARSEGVTVLARGGGTSQCGQTVNHSLVIDCSKYLTQIYQLDVGERRCTVEQRGPHLRQGQPVGLADVEDVRDAEPAQHPRPTRGRRDRRGTVGT